MQNPTPFPKNPSSHNYNNTQPIVKESNGLGTAGFILALIGLFLGWIPFLGWFIWLLGVIFSSIGIFKSPKGLAIIGLVLSFLGIIILITVFGAFVGMAAIL